ncbi:hypothetical protein GALL_429000 [mine drainage metagenome]|uniref:Uncharacterized protein n=1 Tax=mine drainage metagenome TaxID=410659 RepID=A0A1J5PV21_9ZZZZ
MTSWMQHNATATLTTAGTLLPGIATIFLVWATKTEGRRNHESNRRLIESNRHLINLQYRANVYKDVVRFMAETRYQIRRRFKRLQDQLGDQSQDDETPLEVNREELGVFVALELHASGEVLEAYFDWDDALTSSMVLLQSLIKGDGQLAPAKPADRSRSFELDTLATHMSELDRLEKRFLETAKQEVAL